MTAKFKSPEKMLAYLDWLEVQPENDWPARLRTFLVNCPNAVEEGETGFIPITDQITLILPKGRLVLRAGSEVGFEEAQRDGLYLKLIEAVRQESTMKKGEGG